MSPVNPVPAPPQARELVLQRLQETLAALKPNVGFVWPGNPPHRTVVTDLGGRAYTRIRQNVRVDETECPFVEIEHDYSGPETYEPLDEDSYAAEMNVAIWGYARADDQGDSLSSRLRPRLNDLRADLIVATHAFPYYPTPTSPDSLFQRLGRAPTVRLLSQWTEPDGEGPAGAVVLIFSVRYVVNRHFNIN